MKFITVKDKYGIKKINIEKIERIYLSDEVIEIHFDYKTTTTIKYLQCYNFEELKKIIENL